VGAAGASLRYASEKKGTRSESLFLMKAQLKFQNQDPIDPDQVFKRDSIFHKNRRSLEKNKNRSLIFPERFSIAIVIAINNFKIRDPLKNPKI
jgi:hypothetical protein